MGENSSISTDLDQVDRSDTAGAADTDLTD
jgi:hypothetical protein